MDRKQIVEMTHKLDPSLKENDEGFMAAMVLLASAEVGPDVDRCARKTGVRKSIVAEFGKRLTDSGVWKDGKVVCDWLDKKHGGIAFWMDVSVALGYVKRVERSE